MEIAHSPAPTSLLITTTPPSPTNTPRSLDSLGPDIQPHRSLEKKGSPVAASPIPGSPLAAVASTAACAPRALPQAGVRGEGVQHAQGAEIRPGVGQWTEEAGVSSQRRGEERRRDQRGAEGERGGDARRGGGEPRREAGGPWGRRPG